MAASGDDCLQDPMTRSNQPRWTTRDPLKAAPRELLAAIVDSSRDAILSKTLDGTITSWNRAAERMYGYTEAEVLGRSVSLLVPTHQRAELDQLLARLKRGEHISNLETERVRKDGRRIRVLLSLSPIRDSTGQLVGASAIARDVTAQRQGEEALMAAKREAEAANRAKDRFLAVLSHELRTPLTPVLTVAKLLEDRDDLPDNVRADLAMIRRNVELEARLIDDLLDITRITRGKLEVNPEVVDCSELVEQAFEICASDAAGKQLACTLDVQPGKHWIRADAGRIQQVFWNLIKNAVKFTERGGNVTIRCKDGSPGSVMVEVVDDGVGIEPEVVPRVFGAFEQGNPVLGQQAGGLGLGLAISKALVDAHGGRIWAESRGTGHGATFRVELPRVDPPAVARAPSMDDEIESSPHRILLVEDDPDTASTMELLLAGAGHQVTVAGTVREALSRAANGTPFDLIVSDLGLPDGSGHALLCKLRERGISTPAIALSGYGMEEDVQASREAGFSVHLVKPVVPKKLLNTVERVAQGLTTSSRSSNSTR